MEVPPYLLANALIAIIAQRLVQRICKLCSEPHPPTDQEIAESRPGPEQVASASLEPLQEVFRDTRPVWL